MAQTTYATVLVWAVFILFGPNGRNKEERIFTCRPVDFTAGKKSFGSGGVALQAYREQRPRRRLRLFLPQTAAKPIFLVMPEPITSLKPAALFFMHLQGRANLK